MSEFYSQACSSIIRSARKQLGIPQAELAKRVGVSQASWSRFESGASVPDALEWSEFCFQTRTPLDSIRRGVIDSPTLDIKKTVTDCEKLGFFSIPNRYSKDQGSMNRAVQVPLRFASRHWSKSKLDSYFKSVQVDPDYFVNLNNQIGVRFTVDMLAAFVKDGTLTKSTVDSYSDYANAAVHGALFEAYSKQKNVKNLIETYLKNVDSYDCNFDYQVSDLTTSTLDVAVTRNAHMKKLSEFNEVGDLFCQFRRKAFEHFVRSICHVHAPVFEPECFYRGGDKCVYRIALH